MGIGLAGFGTGGVGGTRGDGGVAWEGGDGSDNVLGEEGCGQRDVAGTIDGGILDVEQGAVFDFPREVGALVDGILEEGLVPAHDKVAVVSITCLLYIINDCLEITREKRTYPPVGSPFAIMN